MSVERILIVKLSSLGDVVHAMPAVQDVLRWRPDVAVDWVVERAFAPLVQRCHGVHSVIACDLRRWRRQPLVRQTRQEWAGFRQQLQAQAYDAIIDLQGLSKSALVSWLARTRPGGQRLALAHRTDGSSFEAPSRWVADVAVRMDPHVHAVQRARQLCAQGLGYALTGPLDFGLQAHASALAPQAAGSTRYAWVPRKPYVALVHGTSRADKEWNLDRWVALARRLNHAGFGVALPHGSAAERARSEAIASEVDDAWIWPNLGLDAVVDTLARCAGAIGVDSGLSHVAVALGLPHVQIYNFDTAWRTGPLPELAAQRHQVCVVDPGQPSLAAVWEAWEALETPVLCP